MLHRTTNQRTRRGVSLLESITSLVMLGAVLTLASQALVSVDRLGKQTEQRELASLVLQNTMERLWSLAAEDQTAERAEQIAREESGLCGLAIQQVEAVRSRLSEPTGSDQLTLSIILPAPKAQHPQRVALTVFMSGSQAEGTQ